MGALARLLAVGLAVPPARAERARACGPSMRCVVPNPRTPAECLARNGQGDGYLYVPAAKAVAGACATLQHCTCFKCIPTDAPGVPHRHRAAPALKSWREPCGARGEAMAIHEATGDFASPHAARTCVQAFSRAAAANARAFERRVSLPSVLASARCQLCLTTLLGGALWWYLEAHGVFIRALQRVEPKFDAPVVVVDAMVGARLGAKGRAHVASAYARTYFFEPLIPPWPVNRTGGQLLLPSVALPSGAAYQPVAKDHDSPSVKMAFYLRLQVFLLSSCPAVLAVDSADMLPLRPFTAAAVSRTHTHGFSAVPLCTGHAYFNAGLFAIGGRFLAPAEAARTFGEITIIGLSPPCPDRFVPGVWFSDQSVLNSMFHQKQFRQLPRDMNADKRMSRRFPACVRSNPAVVHLQGSKPWVPFAARHHRDMLPQTLRLEHLWWREYLRDKTVVVGSGPSVRAPFGVYIDMCRSVLRVNDSPLGEKNQTGKRTTHALVHKATRGTPALKRTLAALPRSHVLLAPFGEPAAVLQTRMRQPSGTRLRLSQLTVLEPYYYQGLMGEMEYALGAGASAGADSAGTKPRRRPGAKAKRVKHPLTGTIAIAWAVRNTRERPVYAIGFDMTMGGAAEGAAAYEHADAATGGRVAMPTASLDRFHHVEADRAYLRQLVEDGTVALLDSLPLPSLQDQLQQPTTDLIQHQHHAAEMAHR